MITGKYKLTSSVHSGSEGVQVRPVFAIIKLQVKDDASRISVTVEDFYGTQSSMIRKDLRYGKDQAEKEILDLIDSYENYMKKERVG